MKVSEIFDPTPLGENVIAAYGDWQIGEDVINYLSLLVLKKYYTKVGKIKTSLGIKEIYKLNSDNYYIAGSTVRKDTHSKFEQIFKITLKKTSIPNHSEAYFNVEGVKVPESIRGQGIAADIYRFFVKKLNLNILGDDTQYFGARKLWSHLSRASDITVDIIDITTGNFLEKDVVLQHGDEDWEFDHRVWSYDVDKKHIRLILKDIK